jgi:Holliday junction resolvase
MDDYASGDYLFRRKKRFSIYKKVDSTIHCIRNRPVRYEFTMRRFGWKNVDRIAWGRKTKVHDFLAISESTELEVYVFFPKRNINLRGSRVRKGYRFAPIASEEPFILVAYHHDGWQHVHACFVEVMYFRSEIQLQELQRMTTGAFERKIKSYFE